MLSSPSSSSSIGKRTSSQPSCFCEVEATLRYSNTPRNPGRPFLGCSKYNNEGLPYCKFFKWADGALDVEQEIEDIKQYLLRKEEELRMDKIEFRKRADAMEKMLANILEEVRKQDAQNRRRRTLLNLYWAVAIVVSCYFLLSK
ncbi:uncharacterized protein LOC122299220 [Carya illinoinensis]|uniref:uncharacterized protein LOC122299220 n=1 Tax=Carya illinoinensis TaxID=32201 RepID=UPI001C722C0B|nr:uncharacterized protein LOC122299220 [Carya illinoinensis]